MIIRAVDLHNWADKRDSEDKLPLLVDKLIEFTTPHLVDRFIPTEDRVIMHGPDAIVINDEKTEHVPKGVSLWEMGTNQKPIQKANRDYKKRTENPPRRIIKKETTYIQVTLRHCSYEALTEWHDEKNQENEWKQVRLYDAHKLEKWIRSAPPVEKWLANELNIPINGVIRLEDWWRKWCFTDTFELEPRLLLVDREKQSEKVLKYLKENKDINIKGSSIEESIAFLYSVINQLKEKNNFLDRCLIIEDKETMEYYLNRENLILIPIFDYKEPNYSENMIFKPLLPSDPSKTVIELEDPFKISFKKSLENMDVPTNLAMQYAQDSMGNINILKRLLSSNIKNPEWVNDKYMNVLITLFFIQSWDENYDDAKVIEKLCRTDYRGFIEKCEEILVKEDSPLIKIDKQWFLKSPKDLSYFISMRLTDRHLKIFEEIILDLFDIPDDQIINNNLDNEYTISRNLKEGVLNSLILISKNAENFKYSSNIQLTMSKILYELNENPYCFLVYNVYYLKFFVKISPTTFIELLKNILKYKSEIILELFPISKYDTRYTKLLWALESISENELLFEDIVNILTELSHFNYNKRVYPTPIEILCKLFISCELNKKISFNVRLKLMKKLLNKDIEIGWEILTKLLDKNTKNQTYPYDMKPNDDFNEFDEYHESLENYLLEYTYFDSKKWSFILNYYQYCSDEFRDEIINKLYSVKNELDDKNIIWNKLREIIGKYYDFHKDEEYFKREVEPLEKLYGELTPDNSIDNIRWAFDSNFPSHLTGKYKDHGDNLEKIRKEIVVELYEKQGFEGLYNLINTVNEPYTIAFYCLGYDIDEKIIELINNNDSFKSFSKQYVYLKAKKYPKWIENFISKIGETNVEILNSILLMLPAIKETWNVVEQFPQNIQDYYWINTVNRYIGNDVNELKYYISKLLDYNEIPEIIDTLYLNYEISESEYVGEILTNISSNQVQMEFEDVKIIGLLEYLHENDYDKNKLISLELYFSNCFKYAYLRTPLCIHEEFTKNPELFCEIVEKRFKITYEYDYPYLNILDSWKILPGTTKNNIDKLYLFGWYEKCCELLNNEDLEYVDRIIGMLLGTYGKNKNNWPCEEICEIIEEKSNDDMGIGFKRGLYYARIGKSGVKFNNASIERSIANDYKEFQDKYKNIYPKTVKLLSELEDQTLLEANRCEIDSKLRNFKY